MVRMRRRGVLKFIAGVGIGAGVVETYERFYSMPLLERRFEEDFKSINTPRWFNTVPFVMPHKPGRYSSYFEGDLLVLETLVEGEFPAFRTGQALTPPANNVIAFKTTLRTNVAADFFPLFCEPNKGDYDNHIGFHFIPPNTLRLLTRSGGAETVTNLSYFDPTVWHTYEIWYAPREVVFVIDGTQYRHFTNIGTIHSREWAFAEPAGKIMKIWVKPPYLQPAAYYGQ
jgi:hypothetical protein